MPAANLDALVVTALQLERRAVRAHLEGVRGDNREGLAADRGAFRAGSRAYDIAVIETGAGNIDAAILATRAEEAFRPGMVVMLGIAGGLKDVAIGDVVAASKVYWIEGGKQRAELSPRPDFAETSPSLKQAPRVAGPRPPEVAYGRRPVANPPRSSRRSSWVRRCSPIVSPTSRASRATATATPSP